MNTSQMEPGESVIFQPVLQAYPTRHSWIVTAHISLGNLECHWNLFKRQLTRTQQFLRSLEQHQPQNNSSPHFSWNYLIYRISTNPVKLLSYLQSTYLTQTNNRPYHNAKEACYPSLELHSVDSQGQPPPKIYAASKPGSTNSLQCNPLNAIP